MFLAISVGMILTTHTHPNGPEPGWQPEACLAAGRLALITLIIAITDPPPATNRPGSDESWLPQAIRFPVVLYPSQTQLVPKVTLTLFYPISKSVVY